MKRTISKIVARFSDGTPVWGDVETNAKTVCSGCQAGKCKISHELWFV